jgi:hypothetical protein
MTRIRQLEYVKQNAKWCRLYQTTLGSKVQRTTGQLQGMACHSREQAGVEIAGVLETCASFRDLILQGS